MPTRKSLFSLLMVTLLLVSVSCDCPITRYRPQIRVGQIKVTQSQTSENQPVATSYAQSLETPLVKANPSVIIGLTGYTYTRSGTDVEFEIVNIQYTDISTLNFEVRSLGAIQAQRIFSFRYLAIENGFTQIQVGSYKGHPTNSPVPPNFSFLSPSLGLNTEVALFLNGFKGSNLLNTWSIQISSPRLESSQLKYDFVSNLASNLIETITYSYLFYNKIEFSVQNEAFLQSLQFSSGSSIRVRFNSLSYTDSTFFGLSMISFAPNFIHTIDLALDDKSSIDVGLMINSNLNNLPFQVFILQTFVKQAFICSFCPGNPLLYNERFCVSQCPGDSVPQQTGGALTECKLCAIEDVRVLDPVNRKCVCAVQYFQKVGVCTPCHYTCMSCVSESNLDCLTCDISTQRLTFRELVKPNQKSLTGQCSCPSVGFYEQDQNIRCLACHPDCKTCTGAEDTDCIQCNKQRVKDDLGMCICKNGYTSKSDGSCACLNPKFEVNGACINPLSACGTNEIQVVQNVKANNGNGKGNNKSTTTSTKKCQCKEGFVKVKGQCLPCGPNEEYNDKKGKCQCVKGAIKHKTKGCIVCPADKKYDRESETCICKNKNQFLDSKGVCMSCPQKSVFYQDQCYCINNYFMNPKGKCQKCNKKSDNPTCKKYAIESA